MSKPPPDHTTFGTNTHFVTASTWAGRSLFQTDRLANLFLDTLFHYRCEGKFLLHDFVVMPNHFHLLLTPKAITIERSMQFIKGGFSYRVRKELNLGIEIWERGYVDHRIRDAHDYAKHEEYIWENPVRARLVPRAEDYPYSSDSGRFELDPCPQGLKPLPSQTLVRHG